MTVGTVLKITSTIIVDGGGSVDSATVEITDPDGDQALAPTAMNDEGSNVFGYVWQSSEDGDEGFYRADVRPTSGAYTARSQTKFKLNA